MDRRNFLASTATGSIALMAANRKALAANDTQEKKEEEIRVPKSKVLIVVGDATETVDTLYPYYRLDTNRLLRLPRSDFIKWFFTK
jgi:protease I